MNNKKKSVVIGICGYSGGGKSAVANLLAEVLKDALVISYDDYHESNVEPPVEDWGKITTFNDFKTPLINEHIELLLNGKSINYPLSNKEIIPKKIIILDNALGKRHVDHGQFLDIVIFIDTPLDVAMARRLLRDFTQEKLNYSDAFQNELSSYLNGGREAYLNMNKLKTGADLIVDGMKDLGAIVQEIRDFVKI